MNHQSRPNESNESGMSLIEVITASLLLSVMVMATGMTLVHGFSQRQDALEHYIRLSQLRDLAATIQDTANLPQDLTVDQGVGSLYDSYNKMELDMGDEATVSITIFANEAAVPDILGGPQDLNFDGDSSDNLANQSNGTDLKVVPMQLTMTFGDGEQLSIHRLITVTTNE